MSEENKIQEEITLEDMNLELAGESLLEVANDDDDDVIELTELIEESADDDMAEEVVFEAEDEPISLESEALESEEEEIIELVEAVEQESPVEEEIIELDDLVEDEPTGDNVVNVSEAAIPEDDEAVVLQEPGGLEMPDDGPSIPGMEEDMAGLSLGVDDDDVSLEAPVEPSVDIPVEPLEEPMPVEPPIETMEPMVEEVVMPDAAAPVETVGGLSEEKVEEIVTRVLKGVIEEKADKILLEVAETAIQKEIEKIKALL